MADFPILFLGGAKRVSLAELFIKEGARRKVDVRIYSYELTEQVPIAALGKIIIGKRWNDPDVTDDLRAVAAREGIKTILPFVDPSTVLAAAVRDKIPGCTIPVSDLDVCERFLDKLKSQSWFSENGLPVPLDDNSFPAIAKPVRGSASKGIQVFKNQRERSVFFETRDPNDYLVQKFIRGTEFTIDCYIDPAGKIISTIPRERLEVAGGEVMSSRTVDAQDLVALARKVIAKANLRGPINIQVIREQDTNALYIVEINPRFGGGATLSIEAGANMPGFVLNDALGIPNEPVLDWNRNLMMVRANREFFT